VKHHTRILAVDAGNSRVKWALHENADFVKESVCAHAELDDLDQAWSALSPPDAVVVANVAGKVIGARLAQGCTRWGQSPVWAKGRKRQCGVTNGYVDPGQQGDFLGGMILPGIELMHVLLNENTARLGPERGESVSFPRSTPDAITSGAIRATCGAIEYMHAEMQKAGHGDVSVVATGGAAPAFVSLYERPVLLRERLVLEGLVCIGRSGGE